jgi:uncharacterized protein YcfL
VDSATTIAGTINFSSTDATGRDVIFLGPVTLETGATWNESTSGNGSNNSYDFFSDFTNNATVFVTSDNSTHSFGGTGKTFDGSTNTSIARLNIDGTYTNNGILTVGISLSGTGMLTNSTTGTLNAAAEVSIDVLANAGTMNKSGAGAISLPITNFTNTGTLNLNGTGPIMGITNNAGGTVNLASAGIMEAFNNATATSVLNVSALGAPPDIATLMVTAPGNTVNYNGAGDQTVKPVTYYNLILSGSGNKSISMMDGSTLANGSLSIAPTGTAKAAITGLDLGVNSLALGGFGKVNGTWGSSSSAAEFQNDTYFAPTTGYLSVATDTRLDQTINFTSTPPSNAVVGGPTYTPTATATSGLDVEFTIDPTATSVCSISLGQVSFIGAGTCVINANQAGNENYKPAAQVQQSFTVTDQFFARVFIADEEVQGSPFGLTAGESIRRSFPGIDDGPVKIEGNVELVAAERVIYKVKGVPTSFSEMMGLPNSLVDTIYWLPWYNNVGLDTQLRITNVSGSTATVHIQIGGQEMLTSPFTLQAGESIRVSFPGINDGPVEIVSDQHIVAAERVIYKVNGVPTSFSEMMALPNSQLDTTYWLPWYNGVGLDTQLRFANVTELPASVQIFIGGQEMQGSPFTLQAGESRRVSFPSVNDGPVQIVSDQHIVAAERVIYNVNGIKTSFSEMMALPNGQLDTTYWLPWYNNVGLDTQLRLANATNSIATVQVFVGGVEMQGSPFTLLAGESRRVSFPDINDGLVQVVSDVPIIASERVIYKVNNVRTSFSEMMALPDALLDTMYWFPWYNNVYLNTQLRFGMP